MSASSVYSQSQIETNLQTEKEENQKIVFTPKQQELRISANDIKLIMRRGDVRRTGALNYGDFFDLVTPFEKDYRTMVENRLPSSFSPQYNKADVFLLSTKIYLQNLFRLIISSENKLQGIRLGLCMNDARREVKNI